MKWNGKVKVYPDGSYNIMYCNYRIFNDSPTEHSPKTDEEEKKSDDKSEKRKTVKTGLAGQTSEVRNDSLKRAKDKIQDICLCNRFDYFVTLTFNPDKVDSLDVEQVKTAIKGWLNNGVKRHNYKYIAIPEYHKSVRIHLHALMSGDLKLVDSGHKHYDKVIYNIADWQERFGFCTAIPIDGNINKLGYYITKYITKGNDKIFGRFYWSSRNLNREPELEYFNAPYYELDLPEYFIEGTTRRIKYESNFNFES